MENKLDLMYQQPIMLNNKEEALNKFLAKNDLNIFKLCKIPSPLK